MALFFVNGFTRFPFLAVATELNTWLSGLLLGFVNAGFAVLVAQMVVAVEKKLRRMAPAPAR
jgi:site-specific recombinase